MAMSTIEQTFLVKLINCVKKYPQLYDNYKYPPGIRDIQNECAKIWTLISVELGAPREVCKKKWQVVRGSYQRYLKQIDVARVPYYLSSHMEFLFPIYSEKFKPETQKLENNLDFSDEDDDDDGNDVNDVNDTIHNFESNSDTEDDWAVDNLLKHEIDIDNENDIQPIENISIDEEPQITVEEIEITNNKSTYPDTKYVNDMPFAIKLLNNIKKFPDLYATDGKIVADVSWIWHKISKDLGETQEHCRKKWRIIRGSYQRYLKKIDTASTPYYLSEHMKFLLPFYGNKYLPKSHKYLIKEYLQNNSDDDNIIEENNDDKYLEEINFIDINTNKRKSNNEEDDDIIGNNITDSTSLQNKKMKIEPNLISNIEDNGDLIFLKSLLPDLKQLDTKKKITFRISVLNLVKDLLEK